LSSFKKNILTANSASFEALWLDLQSKTVNVGEGEGKGKGKFCPRTGHEGPERE